MKELAIPMLINANTRALSARLSRFPADSWRAASFQAGPKLPWAQKRTASVCGGVRVLLLLPPSSLVSL